MKHTLPFKNNSLSLITLFYILMLSAGCGRESGESEFTEVTLDFSKLQKEISEVQEGLRSWPSNTVTAINALDCIAVIVTMPEDITGFCSDLGGSTDFETSIAVGLFPLNSGGGQKSVTLNIRKGVDRVFRILGVDTSAGCVDISQINTSYQSGATNAPFVMSLQTLDLISQEASVNFSINGSGTPLQSITGCSGGDLDPI